MILLGLITLVIFNQYKDKDDEIEQSAIKFGQPVSAVSSQNTVVNKKTSTNETIPTPKPKKIIE
jgi:hypothetical protein